MALWAYAAYGALVVIGATNREMTAVLLIISWFAFQPRRWRAGLVYGVLGTISYVAVRLIVDHGDLPLRTNWEVLLVNTDGWLGIQTVIFLSILAPVFIASIAYWRQAPAPLRRATWIISAIYLPLWFIYAVWAETRLLMPILILLLPVLARQGRVQTRSA